MNPADWFLIVVCSVVAAGTGRFIPPLWRLARRGQIPRSVAQGWTVQVVLTGSIPVVLLASWGRLSWYPAVASVTVLAIGGGFVWVNRRLILGALRGDKPPV